MKVLLTGATGLLGKAILKIAPAESAECEITTLNRRTIQFKKHISHDLRSPITLNFKPDVIIHCACEGSVDKVQKEPRLGYEAILLPTLNILHEAERLGSKFIYVSTNAVFDGNNPPYKEEDPLCPVNHYGVMKAACELAIRGSSLDWIVVRPLLMYGWPNEGQRGNWASTWIQKLRRNEECQAVYDVISQPLFVEDCASLIWKAIGRGCWREIYNIAGPDRISLYDFARTIATELHVASHLVLPVSSQVFPSLAPRPKDTSFDTTKINNLLNIHTIGVKEGVQKMMQEKQC
jgi:dTDP-4-dehydrorhamnose reductase